MRRSVHALVARAALLALSSIVCRAPVAAAEPTVSLSHLGPALGYRCTWIASESAIALTRPGLYILVRTGNPLYDVNESVETTPQTPEFRKNDIYIGAALVARLRVLAAQYAPARNGVTMDRQADPPSAAHGALAFTAAPTGVSDAVLISGTGPPNVPLTITLSADIVRDMPRVTLSRTRLETDAAGNFSVQVSTAPLHLQKSLILISATSLPGVTEAHVSFVLGQPSPEIAHPLDELPRDYKPL
jgi:hypothetical protein